jgi:hypothetical protein
VARVFPAVNLRIALRWRFVVRLARRALLRVDLREGLPVAESSRRAPPFRAARLERFLEPLEPSPTFRSLALTPGCAVSTGASRRSRAGRFGFGG